jgi:4'-phosphopantetheinyl transferase
MQIAHPFALSASEIHIWSLLIRRPDIETTVFKGILTDDELDRAARFRFSSLRDSFIVAHGALRYLLGHYLNIRPKDIQFTHGSKEKPALVSAFDVQFNMTHSGNRAAIALTTGFSLALPKSEATLEGVLTTSAVYMTVSNIMEGIVASFHRS